MLCRVHRILNPTEQRDGGRLLDASLGGDGEEAQAARPRGGRGALSRRRAGDAPTSIIGPVLPCESFHHCRHPCDLVDNTAPRLPGTSHG
jgi:hypothetical protein